MCAYPKESPVPCRPTTGNGESIQNVRVYRLPGKIGRSDAGNGEYAEEPAYGGNDEQQGKAPQEMLPPG